jgi:arylsulfatase A-like enzyme
LKTIRVIAFLATIASALLLVSSRAAAQREQKPGRKPNILLIVADDLGYGELGCQGWKDIPTPNIDSIANNGVRFTSGYVSCPVCSPTRAGLMTGRYQQRFGHEFNPGPVTMESREFGLPRDETTLAERLKAAGYVTGMVGKWHLGLRPGLRPTERGFDEFFGFLGGAHSYFANRQGRANPILRGTQRVEETEYLTYAFQREAVAFIDRHKGEPFFLYLPFNAVHAPLQATPHDRKQFSQVDNEKRQKFSAMLAALDHAVGAVLSKVRDAGLEENTLVIFISDNGGPSGQTSSRNDPLRGTKATTWEGGIRIPFMLQWKGRLPAGKVDDRPVISLDIHPTALAACGITLHPEKKSEKKLDGVNLLPFLDGTRKDLPHAVLFWRFGEQMAVRSGDWKLTKSHSPGGQRRLPRKSAVGLDLQLFDLSKDIGESTDLAAQRPEKVRELTALWERWNAELIAPRWERAGNVSPAGANSD